MYCQLAETDQCPLKYRCKTYCRHGQMLDTLRIDDLDSRKEHERSHAAQGSNFNPNGWGKT